MDCRVVLFSGMPGEIIRDYMDLFGPAKLPPKWAFGPWISANHWDSQEKVERAVAQAEEHGFPVCALVAEAWSDEATFYVFRGARYVPKPNGGAFRLEDFDFSDSPGRIPLVWYSGFTRRGSVSCCGRSPSTKSRGRMSRSMRKMSWTRRMPSPGASASTTQMGVPIPSRRDTGSPAP